MVPEMQASDLDIIKNNTVDLLGSTIISHGGSKRKKTPVDPAAEPMPENYFDVYDMPGKK